MWGLCNRPWPPRGIPAVTHIRLNSSRADMQNDGRHVRAGRTVDDDVAVARDDQFSESHGVAASVWARAWSPWW